MIRVPDYPSQPIRTIRTVQDHLDAGLKFRSPLLWQTEAQPIVDLEALIAERGHDVESDYASSAPTTARHDVDRSIDAAS